MIYPADYSAIPGGTFTPHGASAPVTEASFGMKMTPVTNAEYGALARSLGADRYVFLDHSFETGVTRYLGHGASFEKAVNGLVYAPKDFDVEQGDVLIFGSQILLKMVDNSSARYDEADQIFSAAMQPAVGVTYFHAKAWCLLKSLQEDSPYHYDLPTDAQYEYVASDRGTREYGTETGSLYLAGQKLAYVDEYEYDDPEAVTLAVDDPRYEQDLPFDVQTTGNVERWIQMNPAFWEEENPLSAPYGVRGGSWSAQAEHARAAYRWSEEPYRSYLDVGFQPVIVPHNA